MDQCIEPISISTPSASKSPFTCGGARRRRCVRRRRLRAQIAVVGILLVLAYCVLEVAAAPAPFASSASGPVPEARDLFEDPLPGSERHLLAYEKRAAAGIKPNCSPRAIERYPEVRLFSEWLGIQILITL